MSWKVTRLKHIARVSYGLGQPPTLSEAGIPILRATNIARGKFTSKGLIFASKENLPLDRAPLLREGDILVVRSGAYTGDSALVTSDWSGCAPGYDLRVSPSNSHPGYVAYCLLSSVVLDQVDLAKARAAQPHLNAEDLGDVAISVPPLDEQRRIADFLDAETARIDGLISSSKRQRELLEQAFKEILRIWTTTKNGGGRDTGIVWIPKVHESWPLLKVAHQFLTGSGTTPSSSESRFYDGPHPWINSADLNEGVIQAVKSSVTDEALQEFSALKLHPPGSLVVAMYGQGATKGKVGLISSRSSVNQACCVLTPIGRIASEFALFWFRAHKEAIVAMAYGAGQPNLSQELIRQLKIPSPDAETQEQIIAELTSREAELHRRTEFLARREELLAERRQALITAAVTGQLDVTTAREVDASGISPVRGVPA